MPAPEPTRRQALRQERARQLRTLLLLAGAVVLFSILRAHPSRLFNPGWWRLW